jgi:hypothetical protein
MRVHQLLQWYPSEKIVNIDETNWKTVAAGFLTWAPVGAESVNCTVDNDQKFGVTAIAAITADGRKLPLTVIDKGKTERCLRGYGLPPDIWTYTSESGWTNAEISCGYLQRLRTLDEFSAGPLIVVLDTYTAHRCAQVREMAHLLHIDLVFIPPGATDKLQPLDRYVFGVLNSFARQKWRIFNHRSEGAAVTRSRIAEHLVEAWNRISTEIIEKAWNIYHDESWSEPEMMQRPERDDDGDFQPMICPMTLPTESKIWPSHNCTVPYLEFVKSVFSRIECSWRFSSVFFSTDRFDKRSSWIPGLRHPRVGSPASSPRRSHEQLHLQTASLSAS